MLSCFKHSMHIALHSACSSCTTMSAMSHSPCRCMAASRLILLYPFKLQLLTEDVCLLGSETWMMSVRSCMGSCKGHRLSLGKLNIRYLLSACGLFHDKCKLSLSPASQCLETMIAVMTVLADHQADLHQASHHDHTELMDPRLTVSNSLMCSMMS